MKRIVFSKLKILILLLSLSLISVTCKKDEAVIQVAVDSDNDGVADSEDTCPNEAGLAALSGCPDADSDGIADKDDTCPNDAGTAELNGCPDTDGDGILDKDDACPNDAGTADLNGCPDSDEDGVADNVDACPNDAGTAELNGCPDTDGDGVADINDSCPNDFGSVEFDGCPDTDGDGVIDLVDDCPSEIGTVELNGCPDGDGDGVPDKDDLCPDEAGLVSLDGCPAEPDAEESTMPVGPTLLKFNAGGGEVTVGGETFSADQYFVGDSEGYNNPNVTEIENTDLDEIYLTERVTIESNGFGPFSYEIPVSNGTYTVKLFFAEIFWGVTNPQMLEGGVGSRVLDVDIEEMSILNSFDVFQQAGGAATAITKMYDIEVTDGVLNITFTASVDRPKVSAIEVFGNGTIDP